jgi:hypothetical protein
MTRPDHTTFDALHLARGWLSVAIASGKDGYSPALCKTVAVESYERGVRLVATDSYMLLHAWVPNLDHDLEPEPELDEAPRVTAVVMDPHGRAKGFLAHLLKLAHKANGEDDPPVEVKLSLGIVTNADAAVPSLEGLEAKWAALDHPDHERLKLPVYDGNFPSWRALYSNFEAESTDAVALSTDLIGRLGKLGKWWPGNPLAWHFGGEHRAAAVDVLHAENPVSGLVMPVRWNLEHNRPAEEVEAEELERAASEVDA